jgi:SAM-dependent methyltransferase
MDNPNDQTIKTYRDNFAKYVERSPSELSIKLKTWMDFFLSQLPENGRILELGSASGRDAHYFKLKGFRVLCTDVIPEALVSLSKKGFETSLFDFRDTPKFEWLDNFDGLFANAVLIHAPQDMFEKVLLNISRIVKKNGIVALSLLEGDGEEISLEKMDAPRYFRYYSKKELEIIFSKFNYGIINIQLGDVKPGDVKQWLCITLVNYRDP